MTYLTWAVFLVLQNASFTMTSRARNSGSDLYHGIAAVFSNGLWFCAFFLTFDLISQVQETGDWGMGLIVGLVYVSATVSGSVLAGRLLRKYVETGKRRVGHYEDEPDRDRAGEESQRS